MDLVIVESPAKAKTINKYLGEGYNVLASVGHIRDLSPRDFSLDENLHPIYTILESKKAIVERIKAAAKRSSKIYLMTDFDREGESIAWHLKDVLGLGEDDYIRCGFTEITKASILKSLQKQRKINMSTVKAQEARRVLDRLIGYTISPIMSSLYNATSSGRVQTVVTMLVVDRQIEINKFNRLPYSDIELTLKGENGNKWKATLNLDNLIRSNLFTDEITQYPNSKEYRLISQPLAYAIEKGLISSKAAIVCNTLGYSKKRNAPPPFTTDTLLQVASTKLGWGLTTIMAVAQKLYESGIITYMRSDNPNLGDAAIQSVRAEILQLQKLNHESKSLLPSTPNRFPIPDSAQSGHEAIRPTDIKVQASRIPDEQSRELYDLIWRRTIACQMTPMEYHTTELELRAKIKVKGEPLYFTAKGRMTTFQGFMTVYSDDDDSESQLPLVEKGDEVEIITATNNKKTTRPPPHYTEASLTNELKKRDIARPATYASTISTIIKRNYVKHSGKNLEATNLAMKYIEHIRDSFSFVDYEYTARIENQLDKIDRGQLTFEQLVYAENATLGNDIKAFTKNNKGLFSCPSCKKDALLRKKSKSTNGHYYGCFMCNAFLPELDGKPNYDFEPPKVTNIDCPRCKKQKLKLGAVNKEKQGRWFSCSDRECKTFIPATTDTWDSENPEIDLDRWLSMRKHTCPACEKNNEHNFLLLAKPNPEKRSRLFVCENADNCNTFIKSTEETWNSSNPQPDFNHYHLNHSHRCPNCKRHFLKLSQSKSNWFCDNIKKCKTFVNNIQDESLNNKPDIQGYLAELANRVECPNCKAGHLIHSTRYSTFFCSKKCGVTIFPKESDKTAPDLDEYKNRAPCPIKTCDGQLVLTRNHDKYRCTSKTCPVIVEKGADLLPDIKRFKSESLCPKCERSVLAHNKTNNYYFCENKCGAFLNEGQNQLPDYAEYHARPRCVKDGCDGQLVLTRNKDKFRCNNEGCKTFLAKTSDNKPDFDAYEEEQLSFRACPECNENTLKLSRGTTTKKPTFYCVGQCRNDGATYVPLAESGEPDYEAYREEQRK